MPLFSGRARLAPPIENPLVPVVRPFSPKGKQSLYASVNSGALKRAGSGEDLVGALLFLCSDLSAWMTGQTLIVDGGITVRY